jgi:acetamidase/formamidase
MRVVSSDHRNFSFDRSIPSVLKVDPGSTVRFETDDDTWMRLGAGVPRDEIGDAFNPVTGPVSVLGARPGDALRIEVLNIELGSAWAVWMPEFGPLGHRTSQVRVIQTPIEGDRVRISEELTVPLEPMIGCIGVAPASGVGSTVRPVYRFGGNLDLRELSPGAILWLPVQVDGGLLSLGDLHAAMGEGEPTFVSLEASGSATVRIDLESGSNLSSPRLRVGATTICVGMGETPLEAKQDAIDQAFELLIEGHGLEPFIAYAYASARVGLRLGGPAGTRVDGLQAVLAIVPDPR